MKKLIIIGARGYGRVVYNIAQDCINNGENLVIKGFLDDKSDALDGFVGYPPILSSVEDYIIEENDVFVCALGETVYKKKYAEIILNKGGNFISLISPKATLMSNVRIGKGCIIGGFTTVACDTTIGDFVTILGYSSIGHDVSVSNWCHIGAYSFLAGFSSMGECSTMQTSSRLLPHKSVGENAMVGAGSVCIRNVKPNTKVFGYPAQLLKV